MSKKLTDRSICGKLLPAGKRQAFFTDGSGKKGTGRLVLVAKKKAKGELKEFYFRYYSETQERRYKLGVYPELSLSAARKLALQCSEIYQAGDDPAAVMKERARETIAARSEQATFKDVLDTYEAHLEGRASQSKVKNNFKNHIRKKFNSLLQVPANKITGSDISTILREMRLQGITVGCNRVRAELVAAFNYCRKADNDWRTDAGTGKKFNLTYNPVEDFTSPNAKVEKERDRAMSRQELRLYMKALEAKAPVVKAFMQLHVILGGQRPEQLLRLKWTDINHEESHLTIINYKHDDRAHVLPLLPGAIKVLSELASWLTDIGYSGEYVFPGRHGDRFTGKQLHVGTISREFKQAVDSLKFESVQLRDVRRTIKTIGASMLSVETLDRIQAHTVGSRISNRYNRYEYLDVKRQGLKTWEAFLERLDKDEEKPVAKNNILFFAQFSGRRKMAV